MATRFYMSADTFSVVAIATQGTWGNTVTDHEKLYMYDVNPGDMSFVLESYTNHGQGTHRFRTFVSEPMAAGIDFSGASDTYKWCCRISENSTSANVYPQFTIAIVSEDGTTQRTVWTQKGSNEAVAVIDSPESRTVTATVDLNYITVAGDRLVLEVGWDQDASGSTYDVKISRGNTSGTDLSATDGDSDIQNPWFEVSQTITWDAGGEDPPPATNEDWDATIYISAFLDEWV